MRYVILETVSPFGIFQSSRYNRKDGARVTTRIKKVSGDQDLFLSELRSVLTLPKPKIEKDDPIRIRTGGTIEVKGNRTQEVKRWLAGLGF